MTCTVECVLQVWDLKHLNFKGTRSFYLGVMLVCTQSFRITVSRVVVVLICIGYGIVMNTLVKYGQTISTLSFLLFVSSCISHTVEMINQHKKVSITFRFLAILPFLALYLIFLVWCITGLRRTLMYLHKKN